MTIRPMTHADLPAAERLSAESFFELDQRTQPPSWPEPELRPPARSENWIRRTASIIEHDGPGCWVAEDDAGELVGMATSLTRELMWVLATFAVRPGLQGQGVGKQLLDAALSHGRGCLRGMLSASCDPKAVRRYRLAGFSLHPQMFLAGPVDRTALPVVDKVRDGSLGDVDLMNSVDRQARGAAHLHDHEYLVSTSRLTVSDSSTGQGYVYSDGSGVHLLAATNRRTAARLLAEALAGSTPGERFQVDHVTAANEWAVDLGLATRLELHTSGYLALRTMKPPAPYLHHGVFL
jgi:GNAT superfamily N-acetyltransferase